jgi:hypothetical protein
MACIFTFPFLVFVIFRHGVVRKATKRRAPIYIGTWAGDWETLQEEQTIRAHALAPQRSLMMALDPTPLPLAQLCRARAFTHVGEYI